MLITAKNKRDLLALLSKLGEFQVVLVSEGRAADLANELRRRGSEQVMAIVIKD